MVETDATGRSFPGFGNIKEDIIAYVDDTYSLGSDSKKWAAIYVVLALVTSLTIGGVIGLSNVDSVLFVNASTHINGSLEVDENLTAINISASGYYFGNGSQLTDITLTETDPLWTGNVSNVAFTNVNETFDYSVNVTGNLSLTTANYCIIFQSGGKICSGS